MDAVAPIMAISPFADKVKSAARTAAESFESMTLSELLKPVFADTGAEGFDGGAGEAMFKPMLVDTYAQALSRSGGIGLATMIEAQLLRMEAAGGAAR